jgi:hypothetical protein
MISGLQGVPTESPCRTDMVGAFGCLCLRWKMTDLGRDLPASRRGRGGPHRRERTARNRLGSRLWFAPARQLVRERRSRNVRRSPIRYGEPGRVAPRGARLPPLTPTRRRSSTSPPQPVGACDRRLPQSKLGPPLSCLDSTSSLRLAGMALAAPRHNRGSRRGGNGESHPSASTRQQADATVIHRLAASRLRGRRSISPPAVGSAPERRSATRSAPRPMPRAKERSGRPRTRAPHEEARSEKAEAG